VTIIGGIPIPSTSPLFLSIVGVHVVLGLIAVVCGIVAMLSVKGPGRHPSFGAIYYWCLVGIFVTATSLSIVRWSEDYHLFILGLLAFLAASLGRTARQQQWWKWPWFHVSGMGASYIVLLTAFYVDNERTCRSGGNCRKSPSGSCRAQSESRSSSTCCRGIRSLKRLRHNQPEALPKKGRDPGRAVTGWRRPVETVS
jgi:hypothetical protein